MNHAEPQVLTAIPCGAAAALSALVIACFTATAVVLLQIMMLLQTD